MRVSDLQDEDEDKAQVCIYCQQPADLGQLDNHTDIIQLIRARLRLTNLAHQCLRFQRTPREEHQPSQIEKFLKRRSEDNDILALENVAAWSESLDRGPRLFKLARLQLRGKVFQYLHNNQTTLTEWEGLRQLVKFFEKFELNGHCQFFFGTSPTLDKKWLYEHFAENHRHVLANCTGFCEKMQIFLEDGKTVQEGPPSVLIRGMGLLDYGFEE